MDNMGCYTGSSGNLEYGCLLHIDDEPTQRTEVPLPEESIYLSKVLIHDGERVRSEFAGQPVHHDALITVEVEPQQGSHHQRCWPGDMQEGLAEDAPLRSHRRRGYIQPAGH